MKDLQKLKDEARHLQEIADSLDFSHRSKHARFLNSKQQRACCLVATRHIHGLSNQQICEAVGWKSTASLYAKQNDEHWQGLFQEISDILLQQFTAESYSVLKEIIHSGTNMERLKGLDILYKMQNKYKDTHHVTHSVEHEETLTIEDLRKDVIEVQEEYPEINE